MLAYYLPHDDLWQIRAAMRAYWGGSSYTPEKLYHLPVFPIFIELFRQIGLPLRIALEAVYCGASCLLAAVLWRMGTPITVTIVAAFILIFHPASFQLPNRCGAEVLLTPLLMGAIATSLWWWIVRDRPNAWRYAIHSSIWWALTWNVRKESIVIIPIFMLMYFFAFLVDHKGGLPKTLACITLMLCACLAMETAIKVVNWSRWGLYATSLQTAPGFKSAIKSLQSIKPEIPLAFIPVPVEVRQRAYTVSPTFAKLKPYLEGDVTHGWARHSKPFTDSKGVIGLGDKEVSAGWFYWAFYDAVVAAGYASNPGDADRFLAQIGVEIKEAISEGLLPGRWVPMAMIDPAWSKWLPRLPESLHRLALTFIKPAAVHSQYDRSTEEACGFEFDKGANRRSHLTTLGSGKAEIMGWAVASGFPVQAIEIRSSTNSLLGRAFLDIPRPDVDTSRSTGFRLPFTVTSETVWQQAEVAILLLDGSVVRRPIASIPTAQVLNITSDNTVVKMAIDHIQKPDFKMARLWKIQMKLEAYYLAAQSWFLWPGVCAALAVIVIAVAQRRPIDFAIAILAVAVTTRLFFFAVLDATAWQGDQPRYLYAVYPLFSLLLLLVIARSFSLLNYLKDCFVNAGKRRFLYGRNHD